MGNLPDIWTLHHTPIFKIILGLVIFYIGLKMFAGGMKSLCNVEHLEWFIHMGKSWSPKKF